MSTHSVLPGDPDVLDEVKEASTIAAGDEEGTGGMETASSRNSQRMDDCLREATTTNGAEQLNPSNGGGVLSLNRDDSTVTPNHEMPLEDAIVALEFDYYVLGVALWRLMTTMGFCVIAATLFSSEIPNTNLLDQTDALLSALAPESDSLTSLNATVQFDDISSVDNIYDWLSDTLIPAVFVTTDHNGNPLPEDQRGRVGLSNQVLGGVILEMTSSEFVSCNPKFVHHGLYPKCKDEAAVVVNFLPIGMNTNEAKRVIANLKTSGTWVNFRTMQLRVTVATYSGESCLFSIARLKLRFPETGSIFAKASIITIPDYRGVSWTIILPPGCVSLVFAAFLLYLENVKPPRRMVAQSLRTQQSKWKQRALVVGEGLVKFGALPTFGVLWPIMTTTNFSKQMVGLSDDNDQDPYKALRELLTALDNQVNRIDILNIAGALAITQLGLYLLRQLRFHPQLNVFARTVVSALRQFRDFFVVFMIIFLTFVFSGGVLFGRRVRQFSSPTDAMVTCMNMLFGNFDFSYVEEHRGSGTFYWGYMVIVSLVLLNVMLTIVMGTYKTMNKEGYQGPINVLLANRIWYLHRYLVQALKRRKSRVDQLARKINDMDGDGAKLKRNPGNLSHDEVIVYGKVWPPLLLQVLNPSDSKKKKQTGADSTTKLFTSEMLKQIFASAAITDQEVAETFLFLRESLILNEAVTKRQNKTIQHKETELRRRESIKSLNVQEQLKPQSIQVSDEALVMRVAMLEQKLDLLLARSLPVIRK
ncbi:hypothetical protein PHYPSEUDO_007962 [Phytophthora pseudosyringae]|uniref:Polycystin cation channel PKD1/PKD2 domain-containing protein n=1 Tax=Phytophthora pseudosyringae TaxID=221518 RepID=A0A8T1WFN0_9STRA|nr:hypothetical protein PHYPSEUDO_007962 [Phytophthora pseudosyringae]